MDKRLGTESTDESYAVSADGLGNIFISGKTSCDLGGMHVQARSHNGANELTEFATSSWFDPVLDAAGNMTTIPQPGDLPDDFTLVYDAWNRLVAVIDPDLHATNPIARYEYDGLNRRIVKELDANADGTLNETRHFYYNDRWQVVEERVGTDGETARVDCQYVWHPEYVDALAMRYWDSNASGGPETAQYYLQDANYNVTALVNSSGDAVERYAYTPYGKATVLNGANGTDLDGAVTEWNDDSSQAGSDVKNAYLYTGREFDWETGLQINRNRYLHLQLGRWVTRDAIQYQDSFNLYVNVRCAPILFADPMGLRETPIPTPKPIPRPTPLPSPNPLPQPGPGLCFGALGIVLCSPKECGKGDEITGEFRTCYLVASGGCVERKIGILKKVIQKRCTYDCEGYQKPIWINCPHKAADPPCPGADGSPVELWVSPGDFVNWW